MLFSGLCPSPSLVSIVGYAWHIDEHDTQCGIKLTREYESQLSNENNFKDQLKSAKIIIMV